MNRRTVRIRALLVASGALTLGACGSTYVDPDVTVPDTSDAIATTAPAVDVDAPLTDLLAEIETAMFDLDQRIIDGDAPADVLARIDALWDAAEAQIRATDPDDVFNFEQAIELARSGVERRRPADASKGYKLLRSVVDTYLTGG